MKERMDDRHLDAAIHDRILRDTGVVEEDEPTEYSHWNWTRAYNDRLYGEFTADDRAEIRRALGMDPLRGLLEGEG